MKLKHLAARLAMSLLTVAGGTAMAADWVVGANVGNVPWEFQDASGKIVGFEIDLVNEVAKRAGKTVQIDNIPFNGLFPAVQSGRIQIAVSSITITAKRLESLAFAQPYYDSDQSLSVLKTTKIEKLEDLAGKAVGVDTASTGDMYATENTAKLKIAKISRYEGLAPAMLDLAAGRIDAHLADSVVEQAFLDGKDGSCCAFAGPDFKDPEFFGSGVGVGLRKDDGKLKTEINAAIKAILADGTYKKLNDKYFPFSIY